MLHCSSSIPSLSDLGHSHPTPAADGKHDKNVVQLPQMLAGAVRT